MKIKRSDLRKLILVETGTMFEWDNPEHLREIDDLIDSISNIKNTLRRGKDRKHHRKEGARLQHAIEALRYLKRKSERAIERKQMLSEGGRKVPREQKSLLTPTVVTQAVEKYKELLDEFNQYLRSKSMPPVRRIRPTGSSTYYQQDLSEEGEDGPVVYGDIDYLVALPTGIPSENLGDRRASQRTIERDYTREFLSFLQSSHHIDYVDRVLTGETSPTMVVLILPDGKRVQVDTVMTTDEYTPWMETRYTPERGIKGYIMGNLYKALGDTLTLTIGTEGVLARVKDGKLVRSSVRKDVNFEQVSKDPSMFFQDIVRYIAGDDATISQSSVENPGMDKDNITIRGIAKGIVGVIESLEANNSLPEHLLDSREALEEVLSKFDFALNKSLKNKMTPSASTHALTDDEATKLENKQREQYNNVKEIFGV